MKNLNSTSALVQTFIISVKSFLTFRPVFNMHLYEFSICSRGFLNSFHFWLKKRTFVLYNSVQLTYLSLKRAKFGSINDLNDALLVKQPISFPVPSFASLGADCKSEGSGHGKSYFEQRELLWKNSFHFSSHIELKYAKYH